MSPPIPRVLALTVLHHPDDTVCSALAERLRRHFTSDHAASLGERLGVPVAVQDQSDLTVDLDRAETAAVIVLADQRLAGDAAWIDTVERLVVDCEVAGLRARPFLVSLDPAALRMSPRIGRINFLRWDQWKGDDEDKAQRLLSDLTYQCCRILRAWLSQRIERNKACRDAFAEYLANIQLFLSHSKHDGDKAGETLARAIRDHLHEQSGYDSFFDVHDIPAGLPFDDVLIHCLRRPATVFLAVLTDSYASREWCRREVIEAKRAGAPMVVAHAVTEGEERAFPYLGNVPVVRLSPDRPECIPLVVGRLMVEVLKDYLWQCRLAASGAPRRRGVAFLARSPELISLVATRRNCRMIVYPDPPLGIEEADLFDAVAPKVRLLSFTQWLAQA